MNRRTALSHLSKAAAASLAPSLLGAIPLPSAANAPQAEITNGSSSMRFVKGPAGLGVELWTKRSGAPRRVGWAQGPLRILYDRPAGGSETAVDRTAVRPPGKGVVTSTEVDEARHKGLLIRLEVTE